MGSQGSHETFFRRKTKTLIRLCGCGDWFESTLYTYANLFIMLDTVMYSMPYSDRMQINLTVSCSVSSQRVKVTLTMRRRDDLVSLDLVQ